MNVRVISGDCVGNLLQDDGLTGTRRSNDQCALAEAERRDHLNDAGFNARWLGENLQVNALVWVQRSEVLKDWQVMHGLRVTAVHALNAQEREVGFLVLWRANHAIDDVALSQTKTTNLAWRNIDIIG